MSEIKLLPCPFCGGEAEIRFLYLVGIETKKLYWIECSKCRFKHKECRTEEETIKSWNTRKPMQDIVERLEILFKHHNATKTVKRLVLEVVKEVGRLDG